MMTEADIAGIKRWRATAVETLGLFYFGALTAGFVQKPDHGLFAHFASTSTLAMIVILIREISGPIHVVRTSLTTLLIMLFGSVYYSFIYFMDKKLTYSDITVFHYSLSVLVSWFVLSLCLKWIEKHTTTQSASP